MINRQSNSVENIHRIQRKPPSSGAALLEHQHLMRERGSGENVPVPSSDTPEYETTERAVQKLGPVEKKPMGGQQDFSKDYPFQRNFEKKLEKKHKKKSPKYVGSTFCKENKQIKNPLKKMSQKTFEIISNIENSFANVSAIYGDQQSDGSGFFISKNHLVTAAHVVFLSPNYKENQNVLNNVRIGIGIRGQMYEAYLADFDVLKDFAILFIDSVNLGIVNDIRPINLGNSNNIRKGEDVLLIGNPLSSSTYKPTATRGIVSTESNAAEKNMFVVDAEALEGMSGGMCYSLDRYAVVGIVSGYFSNNANPQGGSTTLTIISGIDGVKNSAKKKKIPFMYKEAKFSKIITYSVNNGSTFGDDDVAHQQNNSVGGTGGPGKGRYGKNPRKNFEMSVTQGPGKKSIPVDMMYTTLHGRDFYQSKPVQTSSPFNSVEIDNDIRNHPRIKSKEEQMDDSKGEWMFNIPLGYKDYGENSVIVFKNGNDFSAYYEDKKILESKYSDKNKKPLISLMKAIRSKYGFDGTYEKYIEDYGLGILQ